MKANSPTQHSIYAPKNSYKFTGTQIITGTDTGKQRISVCIYTCEMNFLILQKYILPLIFHAKSHRASIKFVLQEGLC